MPKQRKKQSGSIKYNNTHKFRIGTRKGGVNGLSLTTERLMELLSSPSTRGRDRVKVSQVLAKRSVSQ